MAVSKKDLDDAIRSMNAPDMFPGGSSAMKFIASAETNYGQYSDENALSYGPFQIDPVRYYDIAQNPERTKSPIVRERINKINTFLKDRFEDPSFDITQLGSYNPETNEYDNVNLKYMRDPYVGAALTRMALMQDPDKLPIGDEKLSGYYMSKWGPAVQTEEKRKQALAKYRLYHPDDATLENARLTNSAFE